MDLVFWLYAALAWSFAGLFGRGVVSRNWMAIASGTVGTAIFAFLLIVRA